MRRRIFVWEVANTVVEIVPERKVVQLQSFSTADGDLGSHPMAPARPAYLFELQV